MREQCSRAALLLSAPQSCTLERRKAGLHITCFIFYFCYRQRNMQKGLLCCILNALLHFLSTYAHQPRTTLFLTELSMQNFRLESFFIFFLNFCRQSQTHFSLLLKVLQELIIAMDLFYFRYSIVTVISRVLLKELCCIFLLTAKCTYMGQTFSEGQHFLSRSCRECKVTVLLMFLYNSFSSIQPLLYHAGPPSA